MKERITSFVELFAGVGGMSLGLERAGMVPVAFCEWDKAAAGVLAHHHLTTPIHCDVSHFCPQIKRGSVDLVSGGSPCQDLSVAGKRKGLSGSRSGLFHQMVRVCKRLKCRFVLWENVVGALSSNGGRDFSAVIGSFTGSTPAVPEEGWGSAGFAPAAWKGRWNVAWRVLDSQFFGVPQRRRRVFVVASLGDASCVEILLEPEGVQGDFAPSRETGEGATKAPRSSVEDRRVTGTLDLKSCSANRGSQANEADFLVPDVAHSLCCHAAKGGDPTTDNYVTHTLRGEGFDASEDGTGRGTPLVPVNAQYDFDDDRDIWRQTCNCGHYHKSTLRTPCPKCGGFGGMTHGDPIAFNWQAAGTQTTLGASTEGTNTLNKSQVPAVAFQSKASSCQSMNPSEVSPTLDKSKSDGLSVANASGVRRLTPRECERLQGWPDDHTLHRRELVLDGNLWRVTDKVVTQADGPRYKQCGNGVTANVSEWIARRIITTTNNSAERGAEGKQ